MDLGKTKLDISKSEDGVWVEVDDKTSVKIARYLNPKHKAYVNRRMEPLRRANRLGNVDDETTEKIEIEALAKCVLLDWKGLEVNGVEVKYSFEKAKEFLSDPKVPQFIIMIRELATDMKYFHEEFMDDSVVNIKKS
jgi:hypothetical protein